MIKGFPRPRVTVNEKNYPMPYSAEEGVISLLSDERMLECINDRLCIVCALQVTGPVHVLLKSNSYTGESGPFHDKCLTLTMKMCPHIVGDSRWTRAVETMEEFLSKIEPWREVYSA